MALRIVHVHRPAPVATGAPRLRGTVSAIGRAVGSGLTSLLLLVGAALGSTAAAVGGAPAADGTASDTVALAAWQATSPVTWTGVDVAEDPLDAVPHGAAPSPTALAAPSVAAAVDPDPAASETLPDLDAVLLGLSSSTQVLESGFVRPVVGVPTSAFGPRYHPILHIWKLHSGQDFGAPCGTPVWAAKAGTVIRTGPAGGNGTQVAIDHGNGLVTTYNHLSAYAAKPGMPVAQGQVIGLVGTTGLSTGCHLHFEVILKGAFVDPAPYLAMAPAPAVTVPPAVAQVTATPSPTASATATLTASPEVTTDPSATVSPSTAAPTESTPSGGSSTAPPSTTSPVETSPPATTAPATTPAATTSTTSATTSATTGPTTGVTPSSATSSATSADPSSETPSTKATTAGAGNAPTGTVAAAAEQTALSTTP